MFEIKHKYKPFQLKNIRSAASDRLYFEYFSSYIIWMLNCTQLLGVFSLYKEAIRGSLEKFVTFSEGQLILEY